MEGENGNDRGDEKKVGGESVVIPVMLGVPCADETRTRGADSGPLSKEDIDTLPLPIAAGAIEQAIQKKIEESKTNEVDAEQFAIDLLEYVKHEIFIKNDREMKDREGGFLNYIEGVYEDLKSAPVDFVFLKEKLRPIVNMLFTTITEEQKNATTKNNAGINEIDNDALHEFTKVAREKLWPNPIKLYIETMLRRLVTTWSIEFINVWKKSTILDEDPDRYAKAAKALEPCAIEANAISKEFTNNGEVYFCKTIENINDIRELQKLFVEEDGLTLESWHKKHGAYIKIRLLFAIYTIRGTVDTDLVKDVTKSVEAILDRYTAKATIDYMGEKVSGLILNPTINGEIGPNSVFIDRYAVNAKELISLILKYATKSASDPRAIKDLTRFRIFLTQDPRAAHKKFYNEQMTNEDQKNEIIINVITRVTAILMRVFGTSYDSNRLRISVNDGDKLNKKSGNKHNGFHMTFQTSFDFSLKDNGDKVEMVVKPFGPSRSIEAQVLKHLSQDEYQEDVKQYSKKKVEFTQDVLGIGIGFAENLSNFCDVFKSYYDFKVDKPEVQSRIKQCSATPQKGFGYKQYLVEYIVNAMLTDDKDTLNAIEHGKIDLDRLDSVLSIIEARSDWNLLNRCENEIAKLYVEVVDKMEDCPLKIAAEELYYASDAENLKTAVQLEIHLDDIKKKLDRHIENSLSFDDETDDETEVDQLDYLDKIRYFKKAKEFDYAEILRVVSQLEIRDPKGLAQAQKVCKEMIARRDKAAGNA
jgi:hypothetical protein